MLEHDQAEQEFVIIVPPGLVRLEELSYRLRLKEIKHERVFIPKKLRKLTVKRRAKPLVHHIYGEATFLAFEDAWRQVILADAPMQPLAAAIPDLEMGAEPLDILHHSPIKVRNTHFQAMGHGQFIGIHEQFVRQ